MVDRERYPLEYEGHRRVVDTSWIPVTDADGRRVGEVRRMFGNGLESTVAMFYPNLFHHAQWRDADDESRVISVRQRYLRGVRNLLLARWEVLDGDEVIATIQESVQSDRQLVLTADGVSYTLLNPTLEEVTQLVVRPQGTSSEEGTLRIDAVTRDAANPRQPVHRLHTGADGLPTGVFVAWYHLFFTYFAGLPFWRGSGGGSASGSTDSSATTDNPDTPDQAN